MGDRERARQAPKRMSKSGAPVSPAPVSQGVQAAQTVPPVEAKGQAPTPPLPAQCSGSVTLSKEERVNIGWGRLKEKLQLPSLLAPFLGVGVWGVGEGGAAPKTE